MGPVEVPAHKQILRRHTLSPAPAGAAVTIGAFDGVHLGHRAILAQVVDEARRAGLESVAMTFEPNPNEYFSRGDPPPRLLSWNEKVRALFDAGVDRVVSMPFDERLRKLTARQFVEQILVAGLNSRVLVIGDDFRFGCDRAGNFEMLRELAPQSGFRVVPTATVEIDGERASSTAIRAYLQSGDLEAAARMLGRPYTITGRVIRGAALGRTIGVPTANIQLKRRRAALSGVYVVSVDLDGREIPGVANIGYRPAVNTLQRPLLEVHLLDFSGDLYRRRLSVRFHHRLREERAFDGLDALQQAIRDDIKSARHWIAGHPNFSDY